MKQINQLNEEKMKEINQLNEELRILKKPETI